MKKLTHKEFVEKVFNVLGDKIIILGIYTTNKVKIKVQCSKCNYEWEVRPYSLQGGHECPSCTDNVHKTTESFKKEVYDLVKDEYEVLGEYSGTHSKVLFKQTMCGNEFLMVAKSFVRDGQRCPYERYSKSSKSNSITQGKPVEKNEIIKHICDDEGYELIKGYTNSNINLTLKHNKCGKVLKPKPYNFITTGVRCSCETESHGERVIRMWLEKNNANFKMQYRLKNCRGISKPLPFDFAMLNNDNKLICLIEFDGVQHFSPKFGKETFLCTQKNDKIKNDYCTDKSINLIRIKYNRSLNIETFGNRIIDELKEKLSNINMTIPSEA